MCSFGVSEEGKLSSACFFFKISPIASRVPSVSIALDGIKTLFAEPLSQLQLMIQMICKVYAHLNLLHEVIQFDFVLLFAISSIAFASPCASNSFASLIPSASRIRASLPLQPLRFLLCLPPSARRTLSCFAASASKMIARLLRSAFICFSH